MNTTLIRREKDLFRLFRSLPVPGCRFHCIGGESVFLISHGIMNGGAGPDFLNAVFLLDGELRVGHVEMHMRESDWFAHGHHNDPVYQDVVLHVLAEAPSHARLPFPTVTGAMLADHSTDKTRQELRSEQTSVPELSGQLLAEYAWGRLLRRCTEIIREYPIEKTEGLEHAFLVRLFDSLGYSRNRESMRSLARRILAVRSRFVGITFDETLALLFALAGIPAERLRKVGESFMPSGRLERIIPVASSQTDILGWDYRGRPANAPERRLWAGAKLVFDLFEGTLLRDAFRLVRRQESPRSMERLFRVRLGTDTVLGNSRAQEIVVNVLLPVALTAGILWGDVLLIEGACLLYRRWPGLASNRIVREIEQRFADGNALKGAFFQQGAIEYYQRVLSPDRSDYPMIAEQRHPGGQDEGPQRKTD